MLLSLSGAVSILLSTLYLLFALPPQSEQASLSFAIKDVRIFDGKRTIPRGTVLVRNGEIAAVGKNVSVPNGVQVIEGTGHTLLPGLIDAHVHYLAPRSLNQALVFGVTTELDMGSDHKLVAEVKKLQAENKQFQSADLFSAGTLVTAPGGHGTEYGLRIPTISSPDEASAFVDARLSEGADYIKIIYDDGKTYKPIPTITKETLAAVTKAAHARGKMAVVHIASLREARDAIEAGGDGLMHLFVDREPDSGFGSLLAKHQAFAVPTLTVLEKISQIGDRFSIALDPNFSPYLTPGDIAALRRSFPVKSSITPNYRAAEQTIRQLKAARISILAGSDAGVVHGALLHRELELLVRAGLSPTEVLTAATFAPAARFKLNDRGAIRPGLRADLLLVEGDPTTDIKAVRNIRRIWKKGNLVDRANYLASIEAEKAADARLRLAPPPIGSESGLVSDFEDGTPTVKFGSGWSVYTDKLAGGKSEANFKVVEGGGEDSRRSLVVEGEILPGFPFGWAGVMFTPSGTPQKPANLSSKKQISFWAKGDGQTYAVMIAARSYGYVPARRSFVAGPEWKQFSFELSEFDGMEGHDLLSIAFAGGPKLGKITFQVDNIRFH